MLKEIVEAFRQGLLEGERELAVAVFGKELRYARGSTKPAAFSETSMR